MIKAIVEWFTAPRRHREGVESAMRGMHEAQKRTAVAMRHRFGAGTPGSLQNPNYTPPEEREAA